jgi:SAM-dependent methyltransferase
VDPDVSAHTHARALGIEQTVHGDLRHLDASMRFHAVMLTDVVEHPLSPLPLLRECAARLLPGGVLLLWTPNGGAIDGTEDPVVLRVDLEHMQYLSTRSCTRIAELLELRMEHLETVGFVDPSEYARTRAGKLEGALQRDSLRRLGKRLLRAVPGFSRVNAVRRAFGRALAGDGRGAPGMDDRCGTYHLFAMFRKL